MLAFLDTLTAGLVPCRIVAVGDWSDGTSLARVQYTATRRWAKRGQFDTWPLRDIVPRNAVHRSRQRPGHFVIYAYSWPQIVQSKGV